MILIVWFIHIHTHDIYIIGNYNLKCFNIVSIKHKCYKVTNILYFVPGQAFYFKSLYKKHASGAWCFFRKLSSRNLFFLWSWSWKPLQRSKLISEEIYGSEHVFLYSDLHSLGIYWKTSMWQALGKVKQTDAAPFLIELIGWWGVCREANHNSNWQLKICSELGEFRVLWKHLGRTPTQIGCHRRLSERGYV